MEFKSKICTTREQSEKLLALGLKKETGKCVAQAVKEGKSRHGEMPWYGKY